MLRRIAAAPAWAWLTALVCFSWAVRFAYARHMVGPWIMIDEIVYSELAKSFAATGHFAVRGAPTSGYGIVYPILISPAYRLFTSIPTVYSAIKVINSLLMSLTAVPAYFLARRVVSTRGALVVALLTVAVPSTFYAGTIMTENAFYPIFVLLAFTLVVALERPGFRTVAPFLVVLLIAYETRAQAIAVAAAALTAPLLMGALARRPREALRHRFLYGVVIGLGLLALAAELARGRSIRSLLGAYAAATNSSYDPLTVARWFLWHMAEFDLYVGIVPVLALVLLVARGPSLTRAESVVVATTISLVVWIGIEVAAFATQPDILRIEERNLFYVAPLLFTCLVLWVERGLPRQLLAAVPAAVAVVALAAAIPYERFIGTSATSDTFSVLMLWSVAEWFGIHVQDLRWVVGGVALVFIAVALFVPRRFAVVLPGLVLAVSLVAVQPVDSRTQRASIGAVFQGITRPDRDWISAIVGSSDPTFVSVVWSGGATNVPDRLTVNENEFFNRDVGAIYTTNGAVPGGLAQSPVELSPTTGDYLTDGRPVEVADVLTDTSTPLVGTQIGSDPKKGLVLLRVDGRLQARYVTHGIGLSPDLWAEGTALYRGFACSGGTLVVQLGSDPKLFHRPQPVRAYVGGKLAASTLVDPSTGGTIRVPLSVGPHSTCTVRFRMPVTRVPAKVQPGSADTRHLGIRFLGFRVL